MSKNSWIDKITRSVLCAALILATVMSSFSASIPVQAAITPTASFVDSKSKTGTWQCPGTYKINSINYIYNDSNWLINSHKSAGVKCYEHKVESTKAYSDAMGIYRIDITWYCKFGGYEGHYSSCTIDHDHWHRDYGGRTRTHTTACDTCGSTSQTVSGQIAYGQYCPSNPNSDFRYKKHFIGGDPNGTPYCIHCKETVKSNYTGRCKVQRNLTKTVSWATSVEYTSPSGVTQTDELTGNNLAKKIVKYDSEPVIKIDTTSDTQTGAVVGYEIFVDGVSQGLVGTTSASSTDYSFDGFTYSQKIKGVTEVQFKIYTQAGEFILPPVQLISGVQLEIEDKVADSGFTGIDMTDWTNGYEHLKGNYTALKDDVYDGNRVNNQDKNIANVGVFKMTEPEYGGNNELVGPGTSDTNLLYQWPTNGTHSGTTSSNEPYSGSGRINTPNHYYPGYYYVRESDPVKIINQQWFTTMYRYFTPIKYSAEFINYRGTSYSGDSTDYNTTYKMPNVNFNYDRGQVLPNNEYIRKYYVSLKNTEPWLLDKKATNGNLNSASRWVEYKFMGWKQVENGGTLTDTKHQTWFGTAPYYQVAQSVVNEYASNPNKQGGSLYTNGQKVGNLTTVPNGVASLYTTWKSEMIALPDTVDGSNGYTFINWSNTAYPDNRVYDKKITNNLDDVNYVVTKNTGYTPYKDTTLYAHWFKDLALQFNLNGGKYNGSTATITLTGTIYDYEPHYSFNVIAGTTPQTRGRYDKQVNTLDIYGTFNPVDGTNTKYTKIDTDGTVYRFLGWSTNKDAIVPDSELDVFNPSRSENYNISENTVLYAVWEKVLTADISWTRPMGILKFTNGASPVLNIEGLDPTSNKDYRMQLLIRPSEIVQYNITTPCDKAEVKVTLDTRVTDIYNHGDENSKWFDTLNPSTSEDLISGQKHGMNRHIKYNKNILRRFYLPMYLGTEWSYDTSNPNKTTVPTDYYTVDFHIFQDSHFYKAVYNKLEEVHVTGEMFLILKGSTNDGEEDLPPGVEIDHIMNEFKTIVR